MTIRFFFLFILCALMTACATYSRQPLNEEFLSIGDEEMLWEQSRKQQQKINNSRFLYQNAELEDYLNRVAANLRPKDTPDSVVFRVKVIENPCLNAFAFPDGAIYIHTGLLARMENEAQLAALLGHEMAHCTQRHALKFFKKRQSDASFLSALETSVARLGIGQELARLLGINPSIVGITGYTRELETEADAVGLKMMAAAGYDPTAALRLFEHLREEIELTGVQEYFFFGTHPRVETRIKNIGALLTELNDPQTACVRNRSEFMSKLRGLIADNARLDLMQGRFLMASRGVIKCLAIDSQDARVHYLLGEIYYQRGRKEDLSKAVACFESALQIDPAYVDPHKAIGMIRFKAGQFESARKHFESCLSLSPDYPDKPYIQQYIKKCELRDEG